MSRSKTRFQTCSAVAHAKLRGMYPSIKSTQTQHLLASALGHKTYQSFALSGDARAFDRAALAVLDQAGTGLRAIDFNLQLGQDEWDVLVSEISAKQVVGNLEFCSITDMVSWLFRYAFQAADDPKFDALMRPYKLHASYGCLLSEHIGISAPVPASDESQTPVILRGIVHGEIYAEGDGRLGMAIPVNADYAVERIGRNLYGQATLLSVKQLGEARIAYPDDFDGGMTFGV